VFRSTSKTLYQPRSLAHFCIIRRSVSRQMPFGSFAVAARSHRPERMSDIRTPRPFLIFDIRHSMYPYNSSALELIYWSGPGERIEISPHSRGWMKMSPVKRSNPDDTRSMSCCRGRARTRVPASPGPLPVKDYRVYHTPPPQFGATGVAGASFSRRKPNERHAPTDRHIQNRQGAPLLHLWDLRE
jgi:hypothetical protein